MLEELEIHDVRRLEVKEGEILAVIAPEWCSTAEQIQAFLRQARREIEPMGIRILIFPHGTDLAVVTERPETG